MENPLKKYAIYVTKHGSHAYGLNTPTSDLDIKGVLIPPPEYYHSFLKNIEQIEEHTPNDLVIFEIRKFFRLAADCNPNIIEVLYTDESDILFINPLGEKLRSLAPKFISQKAKFTFSGYAFSQLQRIKGHYRWMMHPPKPPPSRAELGLPEHKDWADKIEVEAGQGAKIGNEIQELINKERTWREARKEWAQYEEWRANRNPARALLEEKWGYDTKHGMHLVRLMRMGEEILTTGKVNVKRPDREELLAIRNQGAWSYEKLIEWAQGMETKLDEIYKSGKSPLPKEPDRTKLDEVCQWLIENSITNCQSNAFRWDLKLPQVE
jgi:hypothetical protein